VDASDVTLTGPATARTGSTVHDHAPGAPAGGGLDLILGGGRRRRPGQPRRALRADHQRGRPDHGQPAVAAAAPCAAPSLFQGNSDRPALQWRCGQPKIREGVMPRSDLRSLFPGAAVMGRRGGNPC